VIGRVRVSIDGRTFEMVCAVLICSKLGQRRKERCMFTRYFVASGCYYGELGAVVGRNIRASSRKVARHLQP